MNLEEGTTAPAARARVASSSHPPRRTASGVPGPRHDVGPVIPAAERALATGSPDELVDLLCATVRTQVEQRLAHATTLRPGPAATVAESREYVEAMLGLQVWAHGVHRQLLAEPHQHAGAHTHG